MVEVAFTNGDTLTIRNGKTFVTNKDHSLFVVITEERKVLIPFSHVLYIGEVKEDEYGNTVFI